MKVFTSFRRGLALVATPLFVSGCAMYPKFLDSPEFQQKAIEAFERSAKNWEAESELHNPELEAYYKISVGFRMIGIKGELGAKGADDGLTVEEQRSKVENEKGGVDPDPDG